MQVLLLGVEKNSIRTAALRQTLHAASIGLRVLPRGSGVFSHINAHLYTLPVVACQRRFGFFDILKQKLKEEVEKNEDFRNKVKTAQETETVKKAADAAAATKVGNARWIVFFDIMTLPSGHCRISGCNWWCRR